MRLLRHCCLAALAIASTALLTPATAGAGFGFLPGKEGFDVAVTDSAGAPETQAGAHPHTLKVELGLESGGAFPDGDLRDLRLDLPPGFLFNPTAVSECSSAAFHTPRDSPYEASSSGESCPNQSQIGTVEVRSGPNGATVRTFGLFNLIPPYGSPGSFGASPYGVPLVFTADLREADAGLALDLVGLSQAIPIQGLELTIWGTPWAYAHDGERGNCLNEVDPAAYHGELPTLEGPNGLPSFHPGTCTIGTPPFLKERAKSYLTLPTSPCGAAMAFVLSARSWQEPGATVEAAAEAGGAGGPVPLMGCNSHLTIPQLQLTTENAAAASGLVFNLRVNDGGGILNPEGTVRPAIKKAIVTLPEGVTINPSLGSGLGVCSEAEFAREAVDSPPGAGCPNTSKIGTVEAQGMLGLPEPVKGSLFVARPYENRFGTLLALYILARSPRRGILIKSVGKVEPDPRSGRLVATFDELPRLLYTHFNLTFREGQRSAMVSPPACGSYPTDVELSSWAEPAVFTRDSTSYLPINRACPAGARPFAPALQAGSLNPQAGAYTPFHLQMTRSDADQEITSYSAIFPPGLLGKIAGVPYCPEAAIEAAKGRTGLAEATAPSCPQASEIGRTVAGYGVGGALAYASGKLYLAGPYRGAPISVVALDSALVGPFDLGVVVVRSAIRIDPRSGRVSIDSSGSDPIPHILKGIPLHLRDIRVYVDRPGFTVNPTSCDPMQSLSTLTGSGADPFTPADDVAATAAQRYQLLGCSGLGFKPRLSLHLRGSAKHARYPSLRAAYVPPAGDANLKTARVTLPPSIFLAQEHIDTVCTRAEFARQACPPGSVYGRARATTPLLEEGLEGPVYLRSSSHDLPDLVASLHGRGIAIEVVGRVDSDNGGLRGTFEGLPDAPVTKFTMTLEGGKQGLLVNAEDLCSRPQRATARFVAHNNATAALRPRLATKCKKRKAKRKHRAGR
jgi:hypothetical protein